MTIDILPQASVTALNRLLGGVNGFHSSQASLFAKECAP